MLGVGSREVIEVKVCTVFYPLQVNRTQRYSVGRLSHSRLMSRTEMFTSNQTTRKVLHSFVGRTIAS